MKKIFKKIVTLNIGLAAKILLKRKKPEIIAITGSAGKTTTKELIGHVLAAEFDVLSSTEGYNTELGAPLILFKEKVPTNINSIRKWFLIVMRSYLKALFVKDYPEKIIIEMGADKPGDINYLVRVFKPDKAIVLTVLPVHTENFKNIENVAREKEMLALGIKRDGKVFLNEDDKIVSKMRTCKGVQLVRFGTSSNSDYQAKNIKIDFTGISMDIYERDKKHSIKARLYGRQMVYPLLAAIAVARSEHISFQKIDKKLTTVKPFRGRMNILEGVRGSIIIDDTYNANPVSTLYALEFMSSQQGRKIAVLGTMGELGEYEKKGHVEVGEAAAEVSDILVTVGDIAGKYIAEAAEGKGMKKEKIKIFNNSSMAGEYLKKVIREGDIILLKGSQNAARMEKAVEIILKDKSKADKLLVRQSEFWKKR